MSNDLTGTDNAENIKLPPVARSVKAGPRVEGHNKVDTISQYIYRSR